MPFTKYHALSEEEQWALYQDIDAGQLSIAQLAAKYRIGTTTVK